ncbi:unnamed protein product [Periconia digitata]|uniref:Uncharacterized protein n=1 Tax=Periconia digitata TaxID=1303443 RepID=A0A9W4XGD6_9PLEO|nr:unnamed protein product [Periconia digitata]
MSNDSRLNWEAQGRHAGSVVQDLVSQLNIERLDSNSRLVKGMSDASASDNLVNDRDYVVRSSNQDRTTEKIDAVQAERLIQAFASLPKDSKNSETGTGVLLNNLYSKLPHPPMSCLGDPYKYRTADGSNNNIIFPDIGKAGSFYCRTVTPQHVPSQLPDPGLIFDALLARKGPVEPHPNKISSLFFAMVTIIIHDIFRTDDINPSIVKTSSYLDLSPLYGADQQTQDSVRAFVDGRLKPDTFAEIRLLAQPPEVYWAVKVPTDPSQRTFGGLHRNAEGYFDDAALIKIITDATEDCARSYGAHRVPIALRAVEMLGVYQARYWGVATLNEVRRHFGLVPHKTFASVNPDPDVAASLKTLYGDVDNVEFYPGVVVEEPKQAMTPGSGLCAPLTTSMAILSDAVSLVRSDRFNTIDFSPALLTAFGFEEINVDSSVYRGNSIYAWYPFTVPSEMRNIKESLHESSDWDYDLPALRTEPVVVTTSQGIDNVFASPSWSIPYSVIPDLSSDFDTMLNPDDPEKRAEIWNALHLSSDHIPAFSRAIKATTNDSLWQNSNTLGSLREFDAAKDVASLSWTRFVARLFGIRMKNEASDSKNLYDYFYSIYTYTFHDKDCTKSLAAQKQAAKASKALSDLITPTFMAVKLQPPSRLLQNIGINLFNDDLLPDHGICLLKRLFDDGRSVDHVVGLVTMLASTITVLSTQAMTQMIDLFLTEPYHSTHWPEIQKLADDNSSDASAKLHQYALEALRLTCPVISNLRLATLNTTIDDGSTTHLIKKGDLIILDTAKASQDPEKFPSPEEIRFDRPADNQYSLFGIGPHESIGNSVVVAGLTEQLRILAGLKGLRRVPGPVGQLGGRKVGAVTSFLNDERDGWDPLPKSKSLPLLKIYVRC